MLTTYFKHQTTQATYYTGPTCSGSTTVGVGLANGSQFGLTLCDNGLGDRLTLSANGLRLADKGSPTAHPAHAQRQRPVTPSAGNGL